MATQTTLLLVHGDPAAGEKCPDDADDHLPVISYFRVKWCLQKALVHLQRYRGQWVNPEVTGALYMPYEKVRAALHERRRELAFRLDRADERRSMLVLETLRETWHRRVSKLDHFLATQLPAEMHVRVSMFLRGVSKAESDIYRSMYRVVHRI